MPREESFPVPLKDIDVTRTKDTSLDVMLEKNINDYWNVDGDREVLDTWTSFTRFTILAERPPDGYSWPRGRLRRKQTTSRPDTLWPEIWKDMSDASKRKEKQKWAIEKPKLDNARRLYGIYFIDPDDEEFKDTLGMRVESWKFRCQPQCLANFNETSTGKPVAQLKNTRQNSLVLLKPMNLLGMYGRISSQES